MVKIVANCIFPSAFLADTLGTLKQSNIAHPYLIPKNNLRLKYFFKQKNNKMKKIIEKKWIAGFWQRLFALLIDLMILGIAGFILGLFFENEFVKMGEWGKLLGFALALAYFGVMNSVIFKGQTIGKKILKLKVVNSSNEPIGLARSCARYAVLDIPFLLNGNHFIGNLHSPYLTYPLSLIVFGGAFSIIYLYIFNRVTRQSLHDLVTKTYVVNAETAQQSPGVIWRPHLLLIAFASVVSVISPLLTSHLALSEQFENLQSTQAALIRTPGVTYASIVSGSTTFRPMNGSPKTTTQVNVQAFLSTKTMANDNLARSLAQTVIKNYPDSKTKDVIQITLTRGFDIGIWSQWKRQTYNFKPADLGNGV